MNSIKDRLPATITTDRLVLTTPTMAHAPDIARLANNRRVHEMMARLPFPYTDADAQFFIEHIVPTEAECCFAAMLGGVEFIGIVGLSFGDDPAPELGYWLGEPYWGHGYATEAATALVAAARTAGYAALRSRALLHNARSRNVLRKAGFTEFGEATEATNNLAGQQMMLMRLEFDR
ncbi:MAG TPA: GNAT family N-acetyltransferase [Devosia sp.]|nr:GNAT family N-acetyltransferase [Devosia sp.]